MSLLKTALLSATLFSLPVAAYASSKFTEASMLGLIAGGVGIVGLLIYRVRKEKSLAG